MKKIYVILIITLIFANFLNFNAMSKTIKNENIDDFKIYCKEYEDINVYYCVEESSDIQSEEINYISNYESNELNQNQIQISNLRTIYVDDDGGYDYLKIQDAIDNANSGDTIFVYNGIYHENLIINKKVILIGEDKEKTIIDAGNSGIAIEVNSNFVEIKQFTITNCERDLDYAGIKLLSDNNKITNNKIQESRGMGILALSSSNNLIEGNFFKDNTFYHIYLNKNSNNNLIQNNIFTKSDSWRYPCAGVWVKNSQYTIICNNNMIKIYEYVGVALYEGAYYNEVYNNFFSSYDDDNHPSSMIQIFPGFNMANPPLFNNVYNNEIKIEDGAGIVITFGEENNVENNKIESKNKQTGAGIFLQLCTKNQVINNFIKNTERGIALSLYASNTQVKGNNLIDNVYGILIRNISYENSIPNSIISNNILENDYGLYITENSDDAYIYNNNFLNNKINAFDECSNFYDNGQEGNYWDDWDKTGPYYISGGGGNVDNHPHLEPTRNIPPNPPEVNGPSLGKIGEKIDFEISTTDYENEKIYYMIDWDDGSDEEVYGPYNSGEEISISHTFNEKGTYFVKVKAKDASNDESPSVLHNINIEKGKQKSKLFFYMLLNHIFGFELNNLINKLTYL